MLTWFRAGLILLLTLVPAAAASVLNRGNGSEIKTLDPQFVDTVAETNVAADIWMGLATFDAAGRPVPGAASDWQVSKDATVWTFHIRPHRWSDGVPVTAEDFAFAWRRLLDPKTAAPYAYNLWILKNARAVSAGKLPPTALGVQAADARTLVVTLEHPAPYLPELLAHPTAAPLPRHIADGAWAKLETYVANGPYLPTRWVPNDRVVLARNPRFYDAAHVAIDTVTYLPIEDSQAALKRFRAGQLDTQTPVPATSIGWLRANLKPALRIAPYLALSYFTLNTTRPPLDDARVRKALNLAFDREIVTAKVLKLGDRPAYALVPPGVADFPGQAAMDFRGLPAPQRLALAQELMRRAGFGPDRHAALALETTQDPDNRRVAAVLQAMLRPIYVDLTIQQADLQLHYRNMQLGDYDIASAAWIADYDDASNFLDLLRSDSGKNYARYRNRAYDAALDAAERESDPAARGKTLEAAERVALKDYPWLAWRFRVSQNLVQPYVRGWIDNIGDRHPSRFLSLAPH
jgi:oligopeptide transport system substrate-binding protein